MATYGFHTALASVATRVLNESVPILIGYFRPVAYVGYYNLPVRLLQYTADAVSRVAMVTGSNTAELAAKSDLRAIARLGVFVNRYCLMLFMPLAIFLLAYGRELIEVWIGAEFAAYSAPLLPVLAISMALAMAGQFNSSAILYGLGKHSGYARGLLVEASLSFAALLLVIPRYGILGAAWVVSVLMILNRGLYAPWLVCRQVGTGYGGYMRSIYVRPVLAAVPVLGLLFLLKTRVPGGGWLELVLAAGVCGTSYFALAFYCCFDREHRSMLVAWVLRRLRLAPGHPVARQIR
jgi:O-antigen/teichoic acid export membrane protein